MCELNRKRCPELYRRNTISVVCLSSRAVYVTRGKDGLVAMCRSSEDAKPVWLLKRSVEFCEPRSWLLTNFTWDFTKGLVREIWRYLETCSFSPFSKTGMTYVSSSKWVTILPEIYILLQSRREELWADMPLAPWALIHVYTTEQFLYTFRVNQD